MIFSIVIPAYNEQNGIADIIERTLKAKPAIMAVEGIDEVELIVVNDGSRDRTEDIVARYPEVCQLKHPTNKGYGAALKTGFENASGEIVGFLDADGTYPPEFFPQILRSFLDQKADIALGSRMMGEKSGMPMTRYIGNRLFALLLSWIVEKKITDTASGLRVFRKGVLTQLYPLPDGLNLTPAMSTRAIHEKLRIIELPMPYDERVGRSKLSLIDDGFRFLRTILGIAKLYNPLKFFGMVGSILMVIGLGLSIAPVVHYLRFQRVEDFVVYRLITIMVLWVTGVNIISFGAFCNAVLGIIHGKQVHADSFWSAHVFRPGLMHKLDKVGYVLMILAVGINYRTILQYATTLKIDVHWSYLITGATLFLVGAQLTMTSFLLKTAEELQAAKDVRFLMKKTGESLRS